MVSFSTSSRHLASVDRLVVDGTVPKAQIFERLVFGQSLAKQFHRLGKSSAVTVTLALVAMPALTGPSSRRSNMVRCPLKPSVHNCEPLPGERTLAKDSKTAFMPQCGLAPGFVGIAGAALAEEFDELDSLHMRVGALPLFPTNALKYNLTWSTDGLINEYCNGCDAIHESQRREVLPLEGLEQFSLACGLAFNRQRAPTPITGNFEYKFQILTTLKSRDS